MIKKNLFGFVAFSAVVGCSLLAAGCGNSSGSTSSGPITGSSYVQFKYTSLAARTDLQSDIAAVSYNFTDSSGAEVSVSKQYPIAHGNTAEDITVTVPAVGLEAAEANAVYFDATGSIVAVGVDKIVWNESEGSAVGTVSSPSVYELGNNFKFILSSDKKVLAPKETVNIYAELYPEGSTEGVNVTPFATISGIDPEILTPVAGETYFGAKYGVASGIKANMAAGSSALTAELDKIYVTDQEVAFVSLSPVNAETTEKKSGKHMNMAYAADDLGLAEVICPIDQKVYLLNQEQFKAEAVYTEKMGKGPVPVPQDVTSAAIFSLTPNGVSASMDKALLTLSGVDSGAEDNNVVVAVSYTPSAGSELMEDSVIVDVAAPSVNIGVAGEDEGESTLDVAAAAGETKSLYLKGIFTWVDVLDNTYMDFVDIAESRLPETAAGITLSNELTAADVSLEPSEDSAAEYILSVPSSLASDIEGTAVLDPVEGLPEALITNIKAAAAGE